MNRLIVGTLFVFLGCGYAIATMADPVVGQAVPVVSKAMVWNGLFSLVLVLGLVFVCVWMLRKLNVGNSGSNAAKMRIIGGIALGVREKVVLLQVGNKQLVLAVTPGRIETLMVLEGEDCVKHAHHTSNTEVDASFAQKLMLALKNHPDV